MASDEKTPFVTAVGDALLRRLIELNPGYLWATDRDLRIVAMFGRGLHRRGLTPERALGRALEDYLGADDPAIACHERALAGETAVYHMTRGDQVWRARVEPLLGAEGAVDGVVGIALEVSDLVHAAHELDESRAKLDVALEQLPAIFWATDEHLCLTSAAGRPIRGRRVETWIGKPLRELFGSDDHPGVAAHENALAGGSGTYELLIDGHEYDIRVQPLRAHEDDSVIGTVGIAVDVSEQLRGRRTAEQLASIVEHSADVITGMDRDGRIFCWNPAAERMFGWTAEEMLGQTTDRIVPPEERREWELLRARALLGETTEQFAATRIRKDGTEIHVWLIRTPIVDPNGEVAGYSTIVRDLARRQDADDRRQTALKLEALARLAGGIAQDFNNLLTAITGYAEIAASDIGAGAGRDALAAILTATQRAGALTHGLLAFSQRRLLQPVTLDLNAEVTQTQPLLERLVGDAVDVRVELAEALRPVRIDPAALRQILFDLALNANDAMPDGGTLTVTTAGAAEHALLRVSDTGIGMDAATQERAFDPFFSTKPPATASGLGLAAVHGTVLQSGGELRLDSSPGGGTTVELRLPFAPVERAAPTPPPTGAARILLVEDEELVRRLVIHALEAEGHAVTAPESASAALELVRAGEPFDLLLTDLVMPELYGDELVERIRELRPGLPAIVMSGYVSDPDSFPPAVDFLAKPFRPRELVAAVARALQPRS